VYNTKSLHLREDLKVHSRSSQLLLTDKLYLTSCYWPAATTSRSSTSIKKSPLLWCMWLRVTLRSPSLSIRASLSIVQFKSQLNTPRELSKVISFNQQQKWPSGSFMVTGATKIYKRLCYSRGTARRACQQKFRNYGTKHPIWKTRVPGISCGIICVILRLAVFTQYPSVTDTHAQRDRRTDRYTTTACTASRGKNWP